MENQRNLGESIEEANLELRLALQSLFRSVVGNIQRRNKHVLLWTVVLLLGVALFFLFYGCPLLHWKSMCPMLR